MLLVLLTMMTFSLTEPCSVTFISFVSNGEIIEREIIGPCPNGTVVAPVDHSLEFGCNFGGGLTFYWVIDATNGSWSDQDIMRKNDGQPDKCWHNVCLRAEFNHSTNGAVSTKLSVNGTSPELSISITCGVTTLNNIHAPLKENLTSHSHVELTFFG